MCFVEVLDYLFVEWQDLFIEDEKLMLVCINVGNFEFMIQFCKIDYQEV